MKAYRMTQWQAPAEFCEVEIREPGPGEVLVKVGGAGVCHSDLHVLASPAGALPYALPFTLGHENAGWVERLGPGVDGVQPGEPVIVYSVWGCGRCPACRVGAENYCERAPLFSGGGLGRDGGMASHMLVPSVRFLCPLGDLDPRQAAPLTDAGLTTYHAIKRSLALLRPGSTAVVIGAGGLGQMAIQLLKALAPARVIAVDLAADKLAAAQSAGADATVGAGDRASEQIRDLTRGAGAELVLDIVGVDATMQLGVSVARRLGHLTVVGIGGGSLPFSYLGIPTELSVASTFYGSIPELAEVATLAQAGTIRPHVELFALEQAPEVYRRLHAGSIRGRAVITPNG
ncbi:MAG TPA: NAD(P)-dependent alcohol dehydrogenase [Candidatus Binatia bacterium]|nr:NAD(P)-dependent alcohol dehydrogenase [Candidatus Binatia bacterium]